MSVQFRRLLNLAKELNSLVGGRDRLHVELVTYHVKRNHKSFSLSQSFTDAAIQFSYTEKRTV